MDSCEFCDDDFAEDTVKIYDNWRVELFEDQYYLGRCLIKLERHVEDLNQLEEEERAELFEKIIPELKDALDNLFEPDHYNYASLGNDCRHLHFHVVPRYKDSRDFGGESFVDENWNQHYMKEEVHREVTEDTFEEIRSEITECLNAS